MSIFIKLKDMETRLQTVERLEKKIDRIENLLEKIINQNQMDLEKINTNLNTINSSTQNMDHHINFVENVFDVVKYPFSSILRLYYNKTNSNQIEQDILNIPLRKTLDNKKKN